MPAHEGSEPIYRFGDFELLPRERILTRGGERVSVTPRMFDLLLTLVEADGRLLSKESLLSTVWADAAVEEGNLNRTISALRKALGEKRNELKFIETVPKTGYRFVGRIEKHNGAHPKPEMVERAAPVAPQRSRVPVFAAIGAFFLLFGLLTIGYFLLSGNPKAATVTDEKPAILRLTNNGFDEDSASWTSDDKIRFIRFTAVNKVESLIMNSDGTDQQQAGSEIRDFRAGVWSPDGNRVLFSKNGISKTRFVANADGSGEVSLPFNIGPFDWSPDGKKIVYSGGFPTDTDNSEIVIYDFETGERTNITNHRAFDANPSFSPDGRQVIFNSDRDGNSEIYLLNADGTGLRRLTNDPAKEAFQAFSPDGTQIVFNSNRDNEKVGIYLINLSDDSPPIKLSDTRHNAEIRPGCWSLDGTRIVFTSDMAGEKFNIYAMSVEPFKATVVPTGEAADIRSATLSPDGQTFALAVRVDENKGELRLLDIASGSVKKVLAADNFDLMPSWSPDGRTIAAAVKSGGNTEIYSIARDTGQAQNLTNHEARDGGPAWSPDGTNILFSSNRDGRSEGVSLYTMHADGGGLRKFTSRAAYEMTPSWAPDGRTIAYACDPTDGTSLALDICIANPNDPATERIVASRRFHDTNPTFSPDGRRIAFVSQSDGNFEIYLMNADGTALVRMTRNTADDVMPVFSRDGSKIYFVSNRSGSFALYEMGLR